MRFVLFLLTLAGGASGLAGSPINAGPWSGAVTSTSAVVKVSLRAEASDPGLWVGTQADLRDAGRHRAAPSLSQGSVALNFTFPSPNP